MEMSRRLSLIPDIIYQGNKLGRHQIWFRWKTFQEVYLAKDCVPCQRLTQNLQKVLSQQHI